ncbi:MAG: lasso peptide biosynthesis B2 protein [Sphingomonadaceae bacterium]|nr:lasso peptide biosynthesis B2 protein [Sphingomonadaceae bacterium]
MRWRLLVAEALALLVLARVLVAGPPLGWWRRWLGPVADGARAEPPDRADRQLARAVERATQRLPGGAKCLPRAMALHWMLRWRHRPSQLVIAVLPGQERGGVDDLHAWIEAGGEILIGELDQPFRPIARFN